MAEERKNVTLDEKEDVKTFRYYVTAGFCYTRTACYLPKHVEKIQVHKFFEHNLSCEKENDTKSLSIYDHTKRWFCITNQINSAVSLAEKIVDLYSFDLLFDWRPIFEIETTIKLTEDQLSTITHNKISNVYKESLPIEKYKIVNVYVPGYLSVGEDLYLGKSLIDQAKNGYLFNYFCPKSTEGYVIFGFLNVLFLLPLLFVGGCAFIDHFFIKRNARNLKENQKYFSSIFWL